MRRCDRILFCLLTAGVCTIAVHLVLPTSPARAATYPQDSGATNASQQKHTVAVCAIHQVMRELLKSDRFVPAREALYDGVDREGLLEEYQSLRTQSDELREQYDRLREGGQIDPGQIQAEAQRIQAEAQRIAERMNQIQQQLQPRDQELQKLSFQQYREAYELVRDASEVVAEDLGYDYVIATERTEDEFNPDMRALTSEINSRPMLVFPDGVDITLDVMAELNLD